jgi:uncharacterized damage-inducible protein DinB
MKPHFLVMARYNAWANVRLYKMAGALPEELYRREVGVYFKSLHGTLNHLLVTDRIWMRRLTGEGSHPQYVKCDCIRRLRFSASGTHVRRSAYRQLHRKLARSRH